MVTKKTPIEFRLLPVCKLEYEIEILNSRIFLLNQGEKRGSYAGCISHMYDLDLTITRCLKYSLSGREFQWV